MDRSSEAVERKRILVIDGCKCTRDSLAELLSSRGHTALRASSGAEGMALLVTHSVDLVLLDVSVGTVGGRVFLRWFSGQCHPIPVMVVSSHQDESSWAERLGAKALFEKPVDPSSLLQEIADLFHDSSPITEWQLPCEQRFRWHRPLTHAEVSR